jgi:hypothetical protein
MAAAEFLRTWVLGFRKWATFVSICGTHAFSQTYKAITKKLELLTISALINYVGG